MTKTNFKSKPEYINELPENVFEIKDYISLGEVVLFDRYWWDPTNNRLIMKPKRIKKYKIVHPMIDKRDNTQFVHMFDINNKQTFVNYDYLIEKYK